VFIRLRILFAIENQRRVTRARSAIGLYHPTGNPISHKYQYLRMLILTTAPLPPWSIYRMEQLLGLECPPHRLSTWSQPVLFGGLSICIDKTRVFVLITLDDSMAFPIHLLRTPLLMIVYVFVGRHLQLQLILRATAKKTTTRPFSEWVAAAPPLLIIAAYRLHLIQPRLVDRGATA